MIQEKKSVQNKNPRVNSREKEILSIIDENSKGIPLPEIAYIMGVGIVTIIQDAKRLTKKGLIKKKDNKYFACSSSLGISK